MITALVVLAVALLAVCAARRLRAADRHIDTILGEELDAHPGNDDQFAAWPAVRTPEHGA